MTRGRKPSARKPERRAEILRAAAAVFAEMGYGGATTAEIARRANASKTTIYTLFTNKAGLLEALFQDQLQSISVGLDPMAALDSPDQYELARATARRILTVVADPEAVALYRVALAEMTRFPELLRIMRGWRNYDGLTAYLTACRERGWMVFDDAEAAADMFVSMATGKWIHRMLIGACARVTGEQIEAHADLTARMFLTAVAPPVAGTPKPMQCRAGSGDQG
jgi:AcrR family transcriptional regulator